jgi:hypothetical protein
MPYGIVQGINSSPGITPTAITGASNDYSPAGMVPYSTLWLDLSAAASLTGLAALPGDSEVTIVNISTTTARILTLNHQNASSAAANRFILPNGLDWIIPNGGSATFKYSGTAARWYLKNYCGNHFPSGTTATPGVVIGTNVLNGIYYQGGTVTGVANSSVAFSWGASNAQINTFGPIAEAGYISPASIGTTQTNYSPTGFTSCSGIRQASSAPCTINSFAAMSSGCRVLFMNISANSITLLHDDGATGTAANRILCPGSVNCVVTANSCVWLFYDGTSARWRVVKGF